MGRKRGLPGAQRWRAFLGRDRSQPGRKTRPRPGRKDQSQAQDLALAREIQKSFLPERRPTIDGYEFLDYYRPANHVGGDYYDYVPLPDGRVAIVVADVVGHGVAAAMMMAKLSGETTSQLGSEESAAGAITHLNDRLTKKQSNQFITLLICILDPATHEVTIANAGHMPPFCRRSDGNVEELGHVADLPIGITEGVEYRQETIALGRGEWLLFYTDGINEAMNPEGRQFSGERIRRHLEDASDAGRFFECIVTDVQQFMGGCPQVDDMCLVCVCRH